MYLPPREKDLERGCEALRTSSYLGKRFHFGHNLVPRACDPREGTRGSGIIRCRKPGILAKIELRIPFQRPIRFLPETDYPRALRSFPRIAGSGNEIVLVTAVQQLTQAPFTLRSIFGTVPLFWFLDYLNTSPRTKKVVRVPILSVPHQKLSVV